MNALQTVNKHKTKALGIVTVALGFVQAYPGLTELLSARAYAWTMFVIGLGVTICGFLNSRQEDDANDDQAG